MMAAEVSMNRTTACLIPLLLASVAAFAADDTPRKPQSADSQARYAAARKKCQENRGTDCESRQGLREWVQQDRPISDAERSAAAGARRHREQCARNAKGSGC
jgi:hypothetical protein